MLSYSLNYPANSKLKTIHINKPKLEVFTNHSTQNADNDRTTFEGLYDKHAPKAFGFITKYTDTKEQAEEVMMNVFLKVWEDIKSFDEDADKKIQQIVLMICKPIYKRN